MNNMNFDENTINKLKDMMNKGELNDVISQIPPEMIQNVSSMMSQNQQNNSENNTNFSENLNNTNTSNYSNTSNSSNGFNTSNTYSNSSTTNTANNFDFSKIDMNTILKMKSVMEKLNTSNDPRSNLLYSLKPYLREERKGKIDQYANLLNVAKIADILKDSNNNNSNNNNNNNKESPNNG